MGVNGSLATTRPSNIELNMDNKAVKAKPEKIIRLIIFNKLFSNWNYLKKEILFCYFSILVFVCLFVCIPSHTTGIIPLVF